MDCLLKAIDDRQQVKITIAQTTELVEEAHRRHETSATATAALGRVLTATIMMGMELKGPQDLITVRINGNGPCGSIIASADPSGSVRGLISNPMADVPPRYPGKLAVGDLVGKDGFLEVSKDLGLHQPFVGKVPLVSGEIAEDFASYYLHSEQIPSLISLGVRVAPDLSVQAAGGFIIQALPGADDAVLAQLENNVRSMPPVSEALNSHLTLEDILGVIMLGMKYRIIGRQPLQFKCRCNRDKLAVILADLSDEELRNIYDQEGKLEVICNFCREIYTFSLEEIELQKKQKP